MEVPIKGTKTSVPVQIVHDANNLPEGARMHAPDTRNVRALVTFDRGLNTFGSLKDDLFVCRDNDCGHKWTILWASIDASQAEDNVQRIEPYCMLESGWESGELEETIDSLTQSIDLLEIEGIVLLWAYVNYAVDSWGTEFFEDVRINGGIVNQHTAESILSSAMRGEALDLSTLG